MPFYFHKHGLVAQLARAPPLQCKTSHLFLTSEAEASGSNFSPVQLGYDESPDESIHSYIKIS